MPFPTISNLLALLLGMSIPVMVLYIGYLLSQRVVLIKQIELQAEGKTALLVKYQELAGKVQALQQPLNVSFSDEQLTGFADKVLNKVRLIVESQQAAELNKMD